MNAVPISPSTETKGMIYFARMLDKIRKQEQGELRADFQENLGRGFDGLCANYLRIDYSALRERVLSGGTDEEILDWCYEEGRQLSSEDVLIWNEYLRKRGWNDSVTEILERRKREADLSHRDDILTMLQFLEVDEGRVA